MASVQGQCGLVKSLFLPPRQPEAECSIEAPFSFHPFFRICKLVVCFVGCPNWIESFLLSSRKKTFQIPLKLRLSHWELVRPQEGLLSQEYFLIPRCLQCRDLSTSALLDRVKSLEVDFFSK